VYLFESLVRELVNMLCYNIHSSWYCIAYHYVDWNCVDWVMFNF